MTGPQPHPSNVLSWLELQRCLRAAGFRYGDGIDIAYAVICAESGKDAGITGPITSYSPMTYGNSDGSVDRGLVQLNSKAQARFLDADAYDPLGACKAMRVIYLESKFKPWVAFTSDSFRVHMPEAQAARQAYDYAVSLGL